MTELERLQREVPPEDFVSEGQKHHMEHSTVHFTTPHTVRIPVPNSVLYNTFMTYCRPSNGGPSALSKCHENASNYNIYASADRLQLFFCSKYNALTSQTVLRKEEEVPLERHVILHLKAPPQMIACPIELLQLQRSSTGRLLRSPTDLGTTRCEGGVKPTTHPTPNAQSEMFPGLLRFVVQSVTSTYVRNCLYGPPSSDIHFRIREVDFLLRTVLFGVNLPTPLPYKCSRLLSPFVNCSSGGGVNFRVGDQEEFTTRCEIAARYAVNLYGTASPVASIQSPLQLPCVKSNQLLGDPYLQVYYGNPDTWFSDCEEELEGMLQDAILTSVVQ
uniref:Uncharacterized protein n=1 Tax=Lygus hesperus TaxID=30085 RepID=A0A0A9YAF0_LYGHE